MKSGFANEEDVKIITRQIRDRVGQVKRDQERKHIEPKSSGGVGVSKQQPPTMQAGATVPPVTTSVTTAVTEHTSKFSRQFGLGLSTAKYFVPQYTTVFGSVQRSKRVGGGKKIC